MAKIYTRTGDAGETALLGGVRVPKNALRIETIGCIDETNAALGVVRVELSRSGVAPAGMDDAVARIQHRLFDLGAELASAGETQRGMSTIDKADVAALEAEIDRGEAMLAPLREFILPGGAAASAQLHFARCVCRRAERRLVELSTEEEVRRELLAYMNRLSDLLFVMSRVVNVANRVADVVWAAKGKSS